MSKVEELTSYIIKLFQDAIQQLPDLVKHILSDSFLKCHAVLTVKTLISSAIDINAGNSVFFAYCKTIRAEASRLYLLCGSK